MNKPTVLLLEDDEAFVEDFKSYFLDQEVSLVANSLQDADVRMGDGFQDLFIVGIGEACHFVFANRLKTTSKMDYCQF